LTKGAIQLRANQLARELHNVEETGNSFKLLDERRKQNAANGAAVQKRAAPVHGGVQTGLLAFFPTANAAQVRVANQPVQHFAPTQVVQARFVVPVAQLPAVGRVVHNDVEVVSPPKSKRVAYGDVEVVSPPKGKRKEDGKANDEDSPPSAEKKHRGS